MKLSAVVPTFGRDEILVETLRLVLALEPPPDELVVVDQTPLHAAAVEVQLAAWHDGGRIRWRRRASPSIPAAMNDGLLAATGDIVLFLDDDLEPGGDLVSGHRAAHAVGLAAIVAGQVLQPGESPGPLAGKRFAFRSSLAQPVCEFMGGNFSARREFALGLGGFDENFVGAAYRFEGDFALRAHAAGASIQFEPAASVRHLRAPQGGTRSFGSHLTTLRPAHAVGEYYHLLRNRPAGALRALLARPWRAVLTRHHLKYPWWIPVTVCAEIGGLAWALWLAMSGRRLLTAGGRTGAGAP